MPLVTRPAVAAHAPAIVALVNRAFAVKKAFVDGERTALDGVLAMLTAAEEHCRSRRVRAIDIAVLSLRPERPPFYRKLGCVDDGIAPCDNARIAQPVHFIRMAKDL